MFASFFAGGFECSTHRRRGDQQRLDVLAAQRHDSYAAQDYRLLQAQGIRTVRDGVRWYAIEQRDGSYDWSSLTPMLAAAQQTGMQVIWDLCHYGYPDDLDIWSPAFVDRFARFATAVAQQVRNCGDEPPWYTPINELSFWSWAGGDVAYLNPFAHHRGFELKVQLARAAIAAMDAVLRVDPRARFVHPEPLIHVMSDPNRPQDHELAAAQTASQYQAWDLISGRLWPQIGGNMRYLDVLGINYYSNNQWIINGPQLVWPDSRCRPLSMLLEEVASRYDRPLWIAETGIEAAQRPAWLDMVCDAVVVAQDRGVPLAGICWYPILNHAGWDDDRHCPNGLLDYNRDTLERSLDAPLAQALQVQTQRFLKRQQREVGH